MVTTQQRIVVIGGGSAGIAAGIAAAEVGFQVLLIEKSAYLGGKATASEVGTICGAYRYSSTIHATLILNGFAKDFVEELAILSQTTPLSNQYGLHYLPYNIQQFKQLSLKKLSEKGVEILMIK
jgi:phytoene dehydrogenase-like protein